MSTVKVDTIKTTGNVEVYTAKAWVNFDGTWTSGDPIRASGNVTSITDNGTANYTVNFANAMSDVNYTPIATTSRKSPDNEAYPNTVGTSRSPTTGSIIIYLRNPYSSAAEDSDNVNVAIFR
jgi:uncharacterized protein (UPF0210 family)